MEVHTMHPHQFMPQQLAHQQENNFSEEHIPNEPLISPNSFVISYTTQVMPAGTVPVVGMGALPYAQPVSHKTPIFSIDLNFQLT
jgi:hypothetical protein